MKTLINRINLIAHKLYTTELVERLINEVKSLKTLFILKEKRMITLFDELRNWIETLKEEIVCEKDPTDTLLQMEATVEELERTYNK